MILDDFAVRRHAVVRPLAGFEVVMLKNVESQSHTLRKLLTRRTETPCPGTVEFDTVLAAVRGSCPRPVGEKNHVVSS